MLTQSESSVIVGLEKVDERPRKSPNVVNISYGREQLPQGSHQQISAGSVKIGVEAGYTFKTVDFGHFV